jgi:hypothetical protein
MLCDQSTKLKFSTFHSHSFFNKKVFAGKKNTLQMDSRCASPTSSGQLQVVKLSSVGFRELQLFRELDVFFSKTEKLCRRNADFVKRFP